MGTTCNRKDIEEEMDKLSDELMEKSNEGEVILCTDANGKVGLMGEEVSRNGRLILNVFGECGMEIINGGPKCEGMITRQNRKRPEERSAIDFVATTYLANQWISKMQIDESGDFRMRNENESDHNTILVDLEISHTSKIKETKRTRWNIRASAEKFQDFRKKLANATHEAKSIMKDSTNSMNERYKRWEKLLYKCAISTIGKTTCKHGALKDSEEMEEL